MQPRYEIMEKQRGIASSLENNLKVVQSSLKKEKVQETVASFNELHAIVQNEEKELKDMLGKDKNYLEFYKDEQEAVDEMFKYFYEMITNIEKLPGKNFKKGAELEIKKVIEMAYKMKRGRNEEIENAFY